MEYVTLNNDIKMPKLGYGVYQTPPEDTKRCVLDAIDVGYRSIDTAQAYGNERGSKSAEKIKHDHRLDVAVACNLLIGNRRHHEHEDEDRRHALQCCDKEAAEETDALGDFREGKAERYA